jgi:hypothetical protein
MKMSLRKKIALLSGTALLALSGTVAACLPNNCEQLRDDCVASGGTGCEMKYARCLRSFGCPIP